MINSRLLTPRMIAITDEIEAESFVESNMIGA